MPAALLFKEVAFDSEMYHQMVALRNAVLREPLGKKLTEEELARDKEFVHIAGFDLDQKVIATTLLHELSQTEVRFRQVAVDKSMQKQFIGQSLMAYCERVSRQKGYQSVLLHARGSAIKFYEQIGYVSEGEMFEETGVPHILMRKPLGG